MKELLLLIRYWLAFCFFGAFFKNSFLFDSLLRFIIIVGEMFVCFECLKLKNKAKPMKINENTIAVIMIFI